MRLRRERKIRKQLRQMTRPKWQRDFVKELAALERKGSRLIPALLSMKGNEIAAKLLNSAIKHSGTNALLEHYFSLEDRTDLWNIAIAIERLRDRTIVPDILKALHDENPFRRETAARILGWIGWPDRKAVDALIQTACSDAELYPVREEALESLAYLKCSHAIPKLIEVLDNPDPRLRFWAVFALGSMREKEYGCLVDQRVIRALESRLEDNGLMPSFWTVGKEALGVLDHCDPLQTPYHQRLKEEISSIRANPNSSKEDQDWAEFYSSSWDSTPPAAPQAAQSMPPAAP